jgi:hypothetical protein
VYNITLTKTERHLFLFLYNETSDILCLCYKNRYLLKEYIMPTAFITMQKPAMVDSLAGTGSRAAHQAEERTLNQPPREVPIMMTGNCWLQKHIEEGTPARGPL